MALFATFKWFYNLIGSSNTSEDFMKKSEILTTTGVSISGTYNDNDFVNLENISYTAAPTSYKVSWTLPTNVVRIVYCVTNTNNGAWPGASVSETNSFIEVLSGKFFSYHYECADGYVFSDSSYYLGKTKYIEVTSDITVPTETPVAFCTVSWTLPTGISYIEISVNSETTNNPVYTKQTENSIKVPKGSIIYWQYYCENNYTLNGYTSAKNGPRIINEDTELLLNPPTVINETFSLIVNSSTRDSVYLYYPGAPLTFERLYSLENPYDINTNFSISDVYDIFVNVYTGGENIEEKAIKLGDYIDVYVEFGHNSTGITYQRVANNILIVKDTVIDI